MTRTSGPPDPLRPSTFRRFLAEAERRERHRNGAGYTYSLTALMLVYAPSVLVGVYFQLTGAPPAEPLLTGPAAVATTAATLVLCSMVWSYLGPVPAPRPWTMWVLSTPLDRGVLLSRRVWARLAVATLAGAALGIAVAAAAGIRDSPAAALIVMGAIGGEIACAAAVVRQQRPTRRSLLPWSLVVLMVAAAAVAEAWHAPVWIGWWWCGVVAAVAGAAATTAAAFAAVPRIPIDRMVAANARSSGIAMAFTEMSLEWIGAEPRRGPYGAARHRPLTGVRQAALAAVCWRELWRQRVGLARFAVTAAVLYPLAIVARAVDDRRYLMAVAGVVAATIAVSGIAGTARRFQQRPRLPAYFGLDPGISRRTALTPPAVLAALWAVLAGPAMFLGGSVGIAVTVAVLGYAVVAYRLTRPEIDSPATDVASRFYRGPAQLIAACVVAVVAVAVI